MGSRADLGGQGSTVAQGAEDASLTSGNGGSNGYVPTADPATSIGWISLSVSAKSEMPISCNFRQRSPFSWELRQ